MTKCLVTGGAGFIGSHIVDKLIELNCYVVVIDNESADCNENFYYNKLAKNCKFDICDYKNTRELYDGVDYVFHLAAESRLQPAIENPINAFYKNTVGTCTVLQCAREAGVKKVIYSSTSSAYGGGCPPNKETDINDCLNPYSLSKVTGEDICKLYTKLYSLNTIIFRYFNVYGDRSPTTGQYSPVIGLFLKQKNNNIPLTVVGDGLQRRDFVNVKDVADINILAAKTDLNEDQYGEIYNIGFGENTSVIEVAHLISDSIEHIPKRIGEAATTLANIDKVKQTFNWLPKISIKDWINRKIN
jgi:UDP-glucose 4-epimerase